MAMQINENGIPHSSTHQEHLEQEEYEGFQFDSEESSVDDFKNDVNLPAVVRFDDRSREETPGLKIYANMPVLFYSRNTKKQASARTIYRDQTGAYYEVGQTILVPEDYQGWFEIVTKDFGRASCYRTIGDLAAVMPKLFFTRSNIKALTVRINEGGEQQYGEKQIAAGSIISTDSVFTAKWKNEAQTGMFKKKNTQVTYEVKYLKCITTTDEKEVLIPLSHKGKFNALYERGKLDCNSVYSMKDILSDIPLPVKVRLLYGKAPVVPCIFTGMLNIMSVTVEESITCSTILHTRNVLFEMPVNASCIVYKANNVDKCDHIATYKDGVRLCTKYAGVYSTMIKLSPKMDTNQQVMQHIPTDPSYMKNVDDALKALDLVTDISFTDGNILEYSDTGPQESNNQANLSTATLVEIKQDPSHSVV